MRPGLHFLLQVIFFKGCLLLHPEARGGGAPPPPSRIFINLQLPVQFNADSSAASIPFSRAGNLVLVKGIVDSIQGNFILDTGCPGLVLNQTYFRHYPVTDHAEERNGITGSSFMADQVQVPLFTFAGFRYHRVAADLANLGTIENTKGVRILGLLGMELLHSFEMIIDFENSVIHLQLLRRKEKNYRPHALLSDRAAYDVIPFDITDNRIMLQTVMAGKKLKLILDSGAETNLLDSRLPGKILDSVSLTGRSLLSGAGNTKIEVLTGNLRSLQIGDRLFGNLPVLVTNLEKTCFSYGGCVDGILGFDFISLTKIGFNFVNRKMYVWK